MVISSNINCIKYMCLSLYMYACHPFKDCRQWRHYSDIWYFCIEMYFAYASCNNKYTVKLVLNMFFIGWETKQHLRAFECQTENQENMSLHIPFIYGNLTLIRESWKKSKTRDRHRARFFGEKSRAQHWTNLHMFPCLGFFRKVRSMTVPKWHIFLFRIAYLLSYWHMPF